MNPRFDCFLPLTTLLTTLNISKLFVEREFILICLVLKGKQLYNVQYTINMIEKHKLNKEVS